MLPHNESMTQKQKFGCPQKKSDSGLQLLFANNLIIQHVA